MRVLLVLDHSLPTQQALWEEAATLGIDLHVAYTLDIPRTGGVSPPTMGTPHQLAAMRVRGDRAVLGNNQSHLTFSGVATDLGVGGTPGRCAQRNCFRLCGRPPDWASPPTTPVQGPSRQQDLTTTGHRHGPRHGFRRQTPTSAVKPVCDSPLKCPSGRDSCGLNTTSFRTQRALLRSRPPATQITNKRSGIAEPHGFTNMRRSAKWVAGGPCPGMEY
jgi:hypothetical protein